MRLNELVESLVDWLRQEFGTEPEMYPAIERTISPNGECVLQVLATERENTAPGMARLYRLVHQSATHDFLILLLNIEQFRQRPEWDKDSRPWKRSLELKIKSELKLQDGIRGNHMFMVSAVSKEPIVRRKSDGALFHDIACICCHIVNLTRRDSLQRDSLQSAIRPNYHATICIHSIALHLLELEAIEGDSWQAHLLRFDWLFHLEDVIRKVHQDSRHVLQPPKTRRSR